MLQFVYEYKVHCWLETGGRVRPRDRKHGLDYYSHVQIEFRASTKLRHMHK